MGFKLGVLLTVCILAYFAVYEGKQGENIFNNSVKVANMTEEHVYDAFYAYVWKELPWGYAELSEECNSKDGLNCVRKVPANPAKERIIKTDYPHSFTY